MKAAGYVRVSTEDQAREGYGLAAQEQSIRSYCQAQGWELVEVYADAGRSGKSTKGREELARLLGDAQDERFQRVIFWKLDRLGRNLRDLLDICDQLERLDVGIVSVQEAIDTGTATGRMIRSVLGALAEFERETIVDRIKAGLAEKARQGELVGPLPLGYRRDESGAVTVNQAIAPLVCEAFQRYATGEYSLREMAQWAARVGLRSLEGNPLDRLSIRKILTNVIYAGQVAYHLRQGGGVVARGSTRRSWTALSSPPFRRPWRDGVDGGQRSAPSGASPILSPEWLSVGPAMPQCSAPRLRWRSGGGIGTCGALRHSGGAEKPADSR